MEFYQLDGIIVGKDVNFKHLLYFFKELAAALGIREVWFKPGYFPFTEPSVEGYVKHSKLGWIEVFPGGMFRPEVMEILGATGYNAAAWGIGVDRLAMVVLGLDDIRLLFTRDIDILKSTRYPGLPYFTHRTSGRGVVVVSTPR
jgi:phenylalanyl-tRNA synthetase alpha chain